MGDDAQRVRLRLPTFEHWSSRTGDLLGSRGRPLNADEWAVALEVFQNSLNYDLIRITEANVVNAPTTLGNTIRIQPGQPMSNATLVHELAHVWQYQTKGTGYITDSLLHQTVATIRHGDRNFAYVVNDSDLAGKSIHDLTAEQQAVVVETWFDDKAKRKNEDYKRMIEQVRRATPLTDAQISEETLLGPGRGNQRWVPLAPDNGNTPDVAPLVRIEFDIPFLSGRK